MSDDEREELSNQDPDFDEDFGGNEWPFSGKGGLDDIPVPTGAACAKISSILGRASEHSGDFSFGGQADQLPPVPCIFVDGVGPVPVPLWEERAQRLIEKCENYPFGHKMDTKMDENVRKSWELQPDKVQIKNPMWKAGIEKMAVTIADRLGYKNIPLQCLLYKLLVYGEGGHFLKHQDTEKENGMIATLVVQPPSLHEGGDLVVYRNGEVTYRHDFGKADGTATYLPHYAVHYADAEHAVEKVTKGYRLALVYSICLPVNMQHLERNPNRLMSGELSDTFETMTSGDNSFALFLVHEYTEKSIRGYGSIALKGVDRARFLALEEANNHVSGEKKLQFHITKLYHHIIFYGSYGHIGDWYEELREEKVSWYTMAGKFLVPIDEVKLKFNFLNPYMETHCQFWQKPYGSSDMHGYLGNEGPTKDSVYSRFAIVAWPEVESVEFTIKFVSLTSAFTTLRDQNSVDTARLQNLIELASTKLSDMGTQVAVDRRSRDSHETEDSVSVSIGVCQVLCQLLGSTGTTSLANLFFKDIFRRLNNKGQVASEITQLVRQFTWAGIGKALLDALDNKNKSEAIVHTLAVARAFNPGEAQQALSALAVEQAVGITDDDLISRGPLKELCSLVFSNCSDPIIHNLSRKFEQMNPRLLNPVIEIFSDYLEDIAFPEDKKALFVSIISGRIEWLKKQIRVLEMPFSWAMPVAEFPESADVEKFLRSPIEAITTIGIMRFEGWGANHLALKYRYLQMNASFDMEDHGRGTDSFVKITKTRAWYDENKENLPYLKKDLADLMNATVETLVKIISKRGWTRPK
ncbi:hypothetical protein ON010_g14822 [Phytophthora cinnamomi]|nr:hypothetical protein ON010_g14822 [Phytophthora cinnamomi]